MSPQQRTGCGLCIKTESPFCQGPAGCGGREGASSTSDDPNPPQAGVLSPQWGPCTHFLHTIRPPASAQLGLGSAEPHNPQAAPPDPASRGAARLLQGTSRFSCWGEQALGARPDPSLGPQRAQRPARGCRQAFAQHPHSGPSTQASSGLSQAPAALGPEEATVSR